jgi:hypothetical protein
VTVVVLAPSAISVSTSVWIVDVVRSGDGGMGPVGPLPEHDAIAAAAKAIHATAVSLGRIPARFLVGET